MLSCHSRSWDLFLPRRCTSPLSQTFLRQQLRRQRRQTSFISIRRRRLLFSSTLPAYLRNREACREVFHRMDRLLMRLSTSPPPPLHIRRQQPNLLSHFDIFRRQVIFLMPSCRNPYTHWFLTLRCKFALITPRLMLGNHGNAWDVLTRPKLIVESYIFFTHHFCLFKWIQKYQKTIALE